LSDAVWIPGVVMQVLMKREQKSAAGYAGLVAPVCCEHAVFTVAGSGVPPPPSPASPPPDELPLMPPSDVPLALPLAAPLAPDALPLIAPEVVPLVAPDVAPLVAPDVAPLVAPDVLPLVDPLVEPLVLPVPAPEVLPDPEPDDAPVDAGVLSPLQPTHAPERSVNAKPSPKPRTIFIWHLPLFKEHP
jgi:hypothetical protein